MTLEDELARVLHRSNARIRAWKAYGLPIEGCGWAWDAAWYAFMLQCLTCNTEFRWTPTSLGGFGVEGWGENAPRAAVDRAVAAAQRYVFRKVCDHVRPLLGPDPAEVIEITRLELLAG